MAKRGKISKDQFRISAPGIDVDTAQPYELLMHEQFLFTQPYYHNFIACPFAGHVGTGGRTATVNVTVPNVTSDPIVMLFPVDRFDSIIWPTIKYYATGNDQSGYYGDMWTAGCKIINSTQVDVWFTKPIDGIYSPNGAYLVLMRTANA